MVKVGDKVWLTVDRYGTGFTGDIVTVTDVDNFVDDGLPIEVNGVSWIRKDQFEPIKTEGTGTLQELNVKPGDVVECVDLHSGFIFTAGMRYTVNQDNKIVGDTGACCGSTHSKFRITSRASDNTPKKWREMSDEEKGALLLAHHRGEVIERFYGGKWTDGLTLWMDDRAYRIKPEPVRETVTLYCDTENIGEDPMPIGTIDLINGTPNPVTIKMERI